MFRGSLLCELLNPLLLFGFAELPEQLCFTMCATVFAFYSFDINVYMHVDKAELCFKDSTLTVQKGFLL